jgi:hypothetical protein
MAELPSKSYMSFRVSSSIKMRALDGAADGS